MRPIIILIIIWCGSLSLSYLEKIKRDNESTQIYYITYIYEETFQDTLIRAHQFVESRNNIFASGDGSTAKGILQILEGTVKDINRFSDEKYCLDDRYDSLSSVEMYKKYQQHYNPEGNVKQAIYLWRRGPSKRHKQGEDLYYKAIMKNIQEQRES